MITLACKKIPKINFQCSVSFSPAEREYENHFFPSLPDFLQFNDKGLKINKIGFYRLCLCWNLLTNSMFCIREVFLREYFSTVCPVSNFRSAPSQKKTPKEIYYHVDGCIYHWPSFFNLFLKSQESGLTNLIVFFLVNTNIEAIYSYHVQLSRNFMSEV